MKITYNLQVLPQRKNSRKDSEETTALKAFATEQRRTIAALKERINVLGEQISEKDELLDEDMVLSEEMDEAVHDVASGEADLRALESAEALLAEVIRQAEDKDAQAKE